MTPDFDGGWVNLDKSEGHVIQAGALHWMNGKISPISRASADSITVVSPDSGTFVARLVNSGQQLNWSNGSVWVRQRPQTLPPQAAPQPVFTPPWQQAPPPIQSGQPTPPSLCVASAQEMPQAPSQAPPKASASQSRQDWLSLLPPASVLTSGLRTDVPQAPPQVPAQQSCGPRRAVLEPVGERSLSQTLPPDQQPTTPALLEPRRAVLASARPTSQAATSRMFLRTSPLGCAKDPAGMLARNRLLELKQLFTKYDHESTNTLEIDDVDQVLRDVGMPVSAESLRGFFEDFSEGVGGGHVSFAEFMTCFYTPKADYAPALVAPVKASDGRFVDVDFPPTEASVFAPSSQEEDKPEEIRSSRRGGPVQWMRTSELCTTRGRLFHHVHPNDLAQPKSCNHSCLLSTLAGIGEFEGAALTLFEERVESPTGMYTCRFFNGRCFEAVVIDNFVPVSTSSGQPLFTKPQDNDQWILLAEKAFAKWFGGYTACSRMYPLVPWMVLFDTGPCRAFGQSRTGRPPFDATSYVELRLTLTDPRKRESVCMETVGTCTVEAVWRELCDAIDMNFPVVAWTLKVMDMQGISRNKTYSVINVQEVTMGGETMRVVLLRNAWASFGSEFTWTGPLSRDWPEWPKQRQLARELGISSRGLDGMMWMWWEDFRELFSDVGIVPKTMEVPRLGSVELDAPSYSAGARHGRAFGSN